MSLDTAPCVAIPVRTLRKLRSTCHKEDGTNDFGNLFLNFDQDFTPPPPYTLEINNKDGDNQPNLSDLSIQFLGGGRSLAR